MESKAKTSSPQRFSDYLNCLQEEFESNVTSLQSSSARRFNIYLGNLKGEIELMALEIESLRKGRDEYKKVKNVRCNICERCSIEITSAPLVLSSQTTTLKNTPSLFSRALFWFKSRDKPSTSRQVDLIQGTITRRPAEHTTSLIEKHQSAITPTPTVSDSRHQVNIIGQSQSVTLPASSQLSASTVDADSGHQSNNWSITYNDAVEKELDVELTHELCHGDFIYHVKFSQDGKSLAAGGNDGKVHIYDVETGSLICVLGNQLEEDDCMGGGLCFSRDGKYLATDTPNGNIYIWELKTKYIRNAFRGHTDYCYTVRFSPNDRLLLTASCDNTVRLWNRRDGTAKFLTEDLPFLIDEPYYSCDDFSPDGKYVAASHRDGIVRIWNVRTGRLMRRVMSHTIGWASNVAFMPDGKGLVTGGSEWKGTNATLKFWDIGSLDATRLQVEEQTEPERVFSGHQNDIFSVTISYDGKCVASGAQDNTVRIWDARNGSMQCIFSDIHDNIRSVDFSQAGCYLATGGEDGLVRVWKYTYVTREESQVHIAL